MNSIEKDAERYRKILAASERSNPVLSVCDDPENDARHKYGRKNIDALIDGMDEVLPIKREDDSPDLYIAYNEEDKMTTFGSTIREMVNDHINDRTGLSPDEPMARLIAVDFRKELPDGH